VFNAFDVAELSKVKHPT